MSASPQDSSPKNKSQSASALLCRICGKPVAVETSKTNSGAKPFHDECYALKLDLENATQEGHGTTTRPWKVIAAEVFSEKDSKRLSELVAELNRALDEQGMGGRPKCTKSDGK